MKSILVTGASSGIGRATAELFLKEGWTVGLLARRREALEEVAAGQPGAVVLPADVTDAKAVEDAVGAFVARAGRLDVLFNNAGIFTAGGTIDEIELDDIREEREREREDDLREELDDIEQDMAEEREELEQELIEELEDLERDVVEERDELEGDDLAELEELLEGDELSELDEELSNDDAV